MNGAEIDFDVNAITQLSEGELETVSGGFKPMESMRFYSWICKTCQSQGDTYIAYDSAIKEAMVAHKASTGHGEFYGLSAFCGSTGGYNVNGIWNETV